MKNEKNGEKRHTYGFDSGMSSVEMNKYNFVTMRKSPDMKTLSSDIQTYFLHTMRKFFIMQVQD